MALRAALLHPRGLALRQRDLMDEQSLVGHPRGEDIFQILVMDRDDALHLAAGALHHLVGGEDQIGLAARCQADGQELRILGIGTP